MTLSTITTLSPALLLRLSTGLLASLALCAAMLAPAFAQDGGRTAGASAVTAVTTVEGVSEYRLDNGLTVLLLPDDSKPLVTVNMVYRVGSRHEGAGEGGMAHLLEHLVFKGTPTTRDPKAAFSARGMQWNGTTAFDRTNYFATFSPDGDNLDWYLGWLADSMVNSFISQEDLTSEMTVVRNEFERGENVPQRVLYQGMLGAAYQWHPYGRPVIGARSDIENVSIARLQRFYRHFYQPDNAVLVVAGNIEPDAVLSRIADLFGPIPRPARQLEATWTEEPVQQGERRVVVRRVGDVPLLAVSYHAAPAGSKDYAAQIVLRQLLTDAPNGRLHRALIESGLAASLYDWSSYTADPGYLYVGTSLNAEEDAGRVQEVLLKELEQFAPASEDEVVRAKTLILNSINRSLLDANGVALSLTDAIAAGDWRLRFALRDWIEEVTPADVDRQARNFLVESNRTLGRFIPTGQPVRAVAATRTDLAGLLKDYRGRANAAAVERFEPSNEVIEARTVRSTLPGGMKLAFLPRATRGERVTGTLRLHWGQLEDLHGRRADALFLGHMLLKGTTGMDRRALNDRLAQLDASFTASGGLTGVTVNFNVPRANLDAALAILEEALRNPVFPEGEFEQVRRGWLAQNQASLQDPSARAWSALNRHLVRYPESDPRSVLTPEQARELALRATPEGLARFYREFAGASHGQLAIVGPIDVDAVQERVRIAFDEWKSPRPYARIDNPWQDSASMRAQLHLPDKANAVYAAVLPVALEEDDDEAPALYAAVEMLGGRAGARLWNRLREKEGLTYGVGASVSLAMREANGRISISGTFAPQNRARFEAALEDELRQVLRHGFTEEELADTRTSIVRRRQQALTREAAVVNLLAGNLYWERTMASRAARDAAYASLTLEQVNAALRKHLNPEKLSVVLAGDFGNAKDAALPAPSSASDLPHSAP